jgi:hypothetical protein
MGNPRRGAQGLNAGSHRPEAFWKSSRTVIVGNRRLDAGAGIKVRCIPVKEKVKNAQAAEKAAIKVQQTVARMTRKMRQ